MTTLALRLLLGRVPGRPPLVGVEHEIQAWDSHGQRDFRTIIGQIAGDVAIPDPGDPRARRLATGLTLTADGLEAELVTPPVPIGNGAAASVTAMLAHETRRLHTSLGRLEPESSLEGFSTHINVSVDDAEVVRVARELASRCAAAAILLMDRPTSPGVLIRPRRSRLEVCGDYLAGPDLEAAITFVCAAAHALGRGRLLSLARGQWQVEPARERFGFFVSHEALGADLGAPARQALVRVGGREVRAQDHLEDVWSALRPFALDLGLEPTPVDERVSGRTPLAMESAPRPVTEADPSGRSEPLTTLEVSTRIRRGGQWVLAPVWLTWTTVAWRCTDTTQDECVHLVMPVSVEGRFLTLLDEGRVDRLLARALRRARPVLATGADASRPGVWSRITPEALVPAERDRSGVPRGGGAGGAGDDRAKQRRDESDAAPRAAEAPAPRSRRLPWTAVAVGALVLAGIGAGATAMNRSGPSPSAATSAPPLTSPPSPTVGATPSVSATPAQTTGSSPATTPAAPSLWVINYAGTMTHADDSEAIPPLTSEGLQLSIFCADDDGQECRINGLTLAGWDLFLDRTGPGTFSASYADPSYDPCSVEWQEGIGPPTELAVELSGDRMTMTAASTETTTTCPAGSPFIEVLGAVNTWTFDGTYVDGAIPGWEVP